MADSANGPLTGLRRELLAPLQGRFHPEDRAVGERKSVLCVDLRGTERQSLLITRSAVGEVSLCALGRPHRLLR